MKKCPNCQKTYEDNMKFCQSDGTRLVVVADDSAADDPYKTMVASDIKLPVDEPAPAEPSPSEPDPDPEPEVAEDSAEDTNDASVEPELLEIPEQPLPASAPEPEPEIDPMQTMVVSGSDTASNIKIPDLPAEEPSEAAPEQSGAQDPSPEIPQFSEPDIQPPDLGSGSDSDVEEAKEPEVTSEPPPVSDVTSSSIPIPSPFDESMPPGMAPPDTPPFQTSDSDMDVPEKPKAATPPASPFSEPVPESEPEREEVPVEPVTASDPFADNSAPEPASPAAADDPFGNNQIDAPLAEVSESAMSASSDSGEGENKTLAFVSLALGILSFLCLGPIGSLGAIITGWMAKKNIANEPETYGGGGLATIGMVLGIISIVLTVLVALLWIVLIVLNAG